MSLTTLRFPNVYLKHVLPDSSVDRASPSCGEGRGFESHSGHKFNIMKKIKFRFHKGGLDESMATVVEVESLDELKAIIEKDWELPIHSIRLKYYCYDSRINWDSYIVMITIVNNKSEFPVGFTNGTFKDLNK